MAEYKLINALPQSVPGNTEFHYGHKCEVRTDGIYVELDDVTAENFLAGGRIQGPVGKPKVVKAPEPVKEPEVVVEPTEIVEDAPKPRGRPAKSGQ